MRTVLLVTVAAATACTPRAVTPPARTFVMDSPLTPEVGKSDMQIDASRIGTFWGPELVAGGARLRRTLTPGVTLEGDGNLLHLTNAGDGADRDAYTGRLGLLLTSSDHTAALGVGIGGGMSAAAGNWGSADLGGMITGHNHYVRPVLGGSIGLSAPFDHRTFVVTEPDSEHTATTLRLPENELAQLNVGLELGPPEAAVVIGMSMIKFWLQGSSVVGQAHEAADDDVYVAVGIGLRIGLQ